MVCKHIFEIGASSLLHCSLGKAYTDRSLKLPSKDFYIFLNVIESFIVISSYTIKKRKKRIYHSSLSLLSSTIYFFNWSIMLLCQEVYAYSGLQSRYPLSRFLFLHPIIPLHSGGRPGSMLCQ